MGPLEITRYPLPCRPPRWAAGGHLQTLWGHLLPARAPRPSASPDYRRREVELSDGERLVVHEAAGTSGVRVYLFHGLSGDADADYVRCAARALRGARHAVTAVNHRGCGAGRGLAWRPYHSGSWEDMGAVVQAGRHDSPGLLHVVIGFSLSANAGLLLAARGGDARPDALIAVNPPADLATSSSLIHRGLNRLYELRFLWRLRREVHRRVQAGKTRRAYRIPRLASLCEFDDLFTAPEVGFADGADYYATCSSGPWLGAIELPTVVLTAADDPFVPPGAVRGVEGSSRAWLHVEPSGGHVGYVMRKGWGWGRWLDGALVHYVGELGRGSASARRRE